MTVEAAAFDFHFDDVVAGFFELPTERARAIVPGGLEPVERCHGRSVLAVLAFDFNGGHVGAYREVVLAILVAPFVEAGRPLPHSALYPFVVGTSTARAREHGRMHDRLPHYDRDVDIRIGHGAGVATASVSDGPAILELAVTGPEAIGPSDVRRLYQVVSTDGEGTYVSDVVMSGRLVEHEEETGAIDLGSNDFTRPLAVEDVAARPFREEWMTGGTETFHRRRRVRGSG